MLGSRCLYTTACRELASHGYIVFAPDHLDGSNHYTEDHSGKVYAYDKVPATLKGEEYRVY